MNPEDLERLLNSHGPALQLYARQWADSPEDCVQQAFIALATADPVPDNPQAWLFRVVRNRAISQRRSLIRRRKHESNATRNLTWFQDNVQQEVDSSELARALEALDATEGEIIVARIWGQLSFEEIGDLVGTSSSTAHRKYVTGLNELRKLLGLTWLIKN